MPSRARSGLRRGGPGDSPCVRRGGGSGGVARDLEGWRCHCAGPPLLQVVDRTSLAAHLPAAVQQDEDFRGFEEHYGQIKQERVDRLNAWFTARSREEWFGGLGGSDRQRERAAREEEI